jgi:predicted nucleotidyltransferase
MKRLEDIELSDKDRGAVEAAARLLLDRPEVEQVILYGSKARGDDRPDSDIDLLVLTKEELGWRDRHAVYDAVYDVMVGHDVVIQVLVEPADRWLCLQGHALPIRRALERDGVRVDGV